MRLIDLRILVVSLGVGTAIGVVGGLVWSLIADSSVWHGIGTWLVIVGIVSFGVGLIGATEPEQGWATDRRKERRRPTLRLVSEQHPRLQQATSLDLAVWGIVVGGGLIGLAMLAFMQAV